MEKWPAKKINACMTSFDLVMNKKVSDFFFLLACKSSQIKAFDQILDIFDVGMMWDLLLWC